MIENVKPVDSLRVLDLQAYPVWQYANRKGSDETIVRPVKQVPVANLTEKVVGTQVQLANGERVWALIGNVDASSPRLTEHILPLSGRQRPGERYASSSDSSEQRPGHVFKGRFREPRILSSTSA